MWGFFGEGPYKANLRGVSTKPYKVWTHMLQRCYDEEFQTTCPCYKGCSVSSEWQNFQNFALDYSILSKGKIDWHLDKDHLFKGNKIYSNMTCTMLPQELNVLLVKNDAARGEFPIGVSFHSSTGLYRAECHTGKGKADYLGLFSTPEKAFLAYKDHKEKFIKLQAAKWRDKIDERVYVNLMKYEVHITD